MYVALRLMYLFNTNTVPGSRKTQVTEYELASRNGSRLPSSEDTPTLPSMSIQPISTIFTIDGSSETLTIPSRSTILLDHDPTVSSFLDSDIATPSCTACTDDDSASCAGSYASSDTDTASYAGSASSSLNAAASVAGSDSWSGRATLRSAAKSGRVRMSRRVG